MKNLDMIRECPCCGEIRQTTINVRYIPHYCNWQSEKDMCQVRMRFYCDECGANGDWGKIWYPPIGKDEFETNVDNLMAAMADQLFKQVKKEKMYYIDGKYQKGES